MTKKEIASAIAEKVGEPATAVARVLQLVFDGIIEVLASEGRIELRNFGIFSVRKRRTRTGRNPRTGERVSVPEKLVVSFKPGQEMEVRARKMTAVSNRELKGRHQSD